MKENREIETILNKKKMLQTIKKRETTMGKIYNKAF